MVCERSRLLGHLVGVTACAVSPTAMTPCRHRRRADGASKFALLLSSACGYRLHLPDFYRSEPSSWDLDIINPRQLMWQPMGISLAASFLVTADMLEKGVLSLAQGLMLSRLPPRMSCSFLVACSLDDGDMLSRRAHSSAQAIVVQTVVATALHPQRVWNIVGRARLA